MKTIAELRAYFNDFLSYNKLPRVIMYSVGMVVTNAIDTQNLHPWKWGENGSWIDYWCAFANRRGYIFSSASIPLSCPNQGKNRLYTSLDFQLHNDIIVGAHVKVSINGRELPGIYIIPICSACNGRHGRILKNLPQGIKMVEMVYPK